MIERIALALFCALWIVIGAFAAGHFLGAIGVLIYLGLVAWSAHDYFGVP